MKITKAVSMVTAFYITAMLYALSIIIIYFMQLIRV